MPVYPQSRLDERMLSARPGIRRDDSSELKRLGLSHTVLHCGGAILIGVILYALTRDPRPAILHALLPITWSGIDGDVLPPQWPSFLHSYALIVATRFVLPLPKFSHQSAALFSLGMAFALELVQHSVINQALPMSNAPILGKLLESINQYALLGTFDVYDLVAIIMGALIALWITRLRPTC